jgi:hypothetical protein
MLPDSHLEKAGYLNGIAAADQRNTHVEAGAGYDLRFFDTSKDRSLRQHHRCQPHHSLRPKAQVDIPAADSLLTGD